MPVKRGIFIQFAISQAYKTLRKKKLPLNSPQKKKEKEENLDDGTMTGKI